MITFTNEDGSAYQFPKLIAASMEFAKLPKLLRVNSDIAYVGEALLTGLNFYARLLLPAPISINLPAGVLSVVIPAPKSGAERFVGVPELYTRISYRGGVGWVKITSDLGIEYTQGSAQEAIASVNEPTTPLNYLFDNIPEAECRLFVKLDRADIGTVYLPIDATGANKWPYEDYTTDTSHNTLRLPAEAFSKVVPLNIAAGGFATLELAAKSEADRNYVVEGLLTVGGVTDSITSFTAGIIPSEAEAQGEISPVPLSEAVYYTGIAVVGNDLYRVGGYKDNGRNSWVTERFDLLNNYVRTGLDNCPDKLRAHGLVSYSGKIYTVCGIRANGSAISKVYEYDPATDNWSLKTNAPIAMYSNLVAVVGDKLWVFGGATGSFAKNTNIYVYDFVANTWATYAGRATTRSACAAVGTDIFVFSGSDLGTGVYKIDTSTSPHTPTKIADLPATIVDHTAAVVGSGRIAIMGGYTNTMFADIWKFNPETLLTETLSGNFGLATRRYVAACSREVSPGTFEAFFAGGAVSAASDQLGRYFEKLYIQNFMEQGSCDVVWNNKVIGGTPLNTFNFAAPRAVLLPMVEVGGVVCVDADYMAALPNPPKPTYAIETKLRTQLPVYRYRYVFCKQLSLYTVSGGYGAYSMQPASGGLQRIRGDAGWALVELSRDGENFYPSLTLDTGVENDVEIYVRIRVGNSYPKAPKSSIIKLLSEAVK